MDFSDDDCDDCWILGEGIQMIEVDPDAKVAYEGVQVSDQPLYMTMPYASLEVSNLADAMVQQDRKRDETADRVESLSLRGKALFSAASQVFASEYGVECQVEGDALLGVADLARLTADVFQTVLGEEDIIVRVGHVGALTATSDDISNMSVWTGKKFERVTGTGEFKVHAVSSKIDGTPLVPVSVYFGNSLKNFCWIFEHNGYVLRSCSEFIERRAELKNGVVYTSGTANEITIGSKKYQVVMSPIVGPTEIAQILCLESVSDGIILHAGIFEYKVKYSITVDLLFESMIGYTSDRVAVMKIAVPNGVHEIDLETKRMVRPRLDRRVGNSSRLLKKLRSAGSVSQFLNAIKIAGVYVCDTLAEHLVYTGEGVQVGVLTACQPRSCTISDVDIMCELPVSIRTGLLKNCEMGINYVKRYLSMKGYVIVNGDVIWIQDVLPRAKGIRRKPSTNTMEGKGVGLYVYPGEMFMDNSYYHYLPRQYTDGRGVALSCIVTSSRVARRRAEK